MMSMRLKCYTCGKIISTQVPTDTVVRAYCECPECIQKSENKFDKAVKLLSAIVDANDKYDDMTQPIEEARRWLTK